MKYIAFLRGINVGGKNLIKMSDLKKTFEALGFKNVQTVIASGNVIFDGEKKNLIKIPYNAVIISEKELQKVIDNAPKSWQRKDLRKYVAFVKPPLSANDIAKEIEINSKVDSVDFGDGVIYMSTALNGLMKSGFKKLITKKIYKEITMRNFNTVEKISKLI